MSDSKSPLSYPPIYAQLVQRVGLEGQVVPVNLPSPSAAIVLRRKFYSYRAALGKADPDDDLFIAAQGMSVVLDGTVVTFFPRDNTPETAAIEAALEKGDT